jgi:hypothetical protein
MALVAILALLAILVIVPRSARARASRPMRVLWGAALWLVITSLGFALMAILIAPSPRVIEELVAPAIAIYFVGCSITGAAIPAVTARLFGTDWCTVPPR